MDTIRLHTNDQGVVDIYINGENLVNLLKEYEHPFAKSIAGAYEGLTPEYIFSPSKHLLGEPAEEILEYDGKLSLLDCECGCPGCWPFLVNITLEGDSVIWSDFEQPHREEWNYDKFGPFVFDRREYELALSGSD